jgi:hypothetical protein
MLVVVAGVSFSEALVKILLASPERRKWAWISGVALLLALAALLYLPRLRSDECFNQRTGPIKWYVEEPSGDVTIFNSGGFDIVTGTEKQPVTPEICASFAKQENKGRPRRITANVHDIEFFDPSSGRTRVWYSRGADGGYELFDSRGSNPITSEPLLPVTKTIVAEMIAEEAEQARKRTEAAEAQEREDALLEKAGPANQTQENAVTCPGVPPSRTIVLDTSWKDINPSNCDLIIAVIKGTMLFEFGDGTGTRISTGQKLLPRFDKVFKRARAVSGQAEMYLMQCPPSSTDPSDGTWSCGRR